MESDISSIEPEPVCNGTSNDQDISNSKASVDYQTLATKLHQLATSDSPSPPPVTGKKVPTTPPHTPPPASIENTEEEKPVVSEPQEAVISRDEFGIEYIRYQSELQMTDLMKLISSDLSEPYSIYTYRYFIHNWPNLCFLAMDAEKTVGAIVCKLDLHKRTLRNRGYIGMLAVDPSHRRKKIGSNLVRIAIEAMMAAQADEIVLETEVTNLAALNLYERLGFVKDKKLHRYYLNGVDAIRLKLWVT